MALKLADFELIKDLGSGSFGSVKLVKKKEDSQIMAMKTVSLGRLTQKQKDNALNQIRLLASIQIPNVIAFKGSLFDQLSSSLCILTEFADGGDLQAKVQALRNEQRLYGFEEKFVWKVAYQILQGLKTLHRNKIIHRDIKSANIFFVNGIAKLGDLNVSKVAEQGLCQTQTGTPYYTSPQIWTGEKYGNKCDIWSLGVLLYEMSALTMPFKGKDLPSLYKTVMQGKYDEIPEVYSEELRNLIRMCLIVKEQMRPSASELLQTTILRGIQMSLEIFNAEEGQIKLLDPIKCPKVLKFLAGKLPKSRLEQEKKVTFYKTTKKEGQQCSFKIKSIKKERSDKNFQFEGTQQKKSACLILKKDRQQNKSALVNPTISRTPSRKHTNLVQQPQIKQASRKLIHKQQPKRHLLEKVSSKKTIKFPHLESQIRTLLPPLQTNVQQKKSSMHISSSKKLIKSNSSKHIALQKEN